jgi:hypothetical protein
MRATILAAALLLGACGNDGGNSDGGTSSDMAVSSGGGGDMTTLVNGCPPLLNPQANPDGGAGGDTWTSFAQGFFATYCTRCHSSALSGTARNGAPVGYNWDDEAAVRMHLADIRDAVGVGNFMPPTPPTPGCAERQRIVRWIDAAAP